MSESRRASALTGLVVIGLVAAACGGPAAVSPSPASGSPSASAAPSAPGSSSPSGSPGSAATGEAIEHPTGSTDVILRMEDVGGFVPLELLAMRVPAWTLYGDGTLIVAPDEAGLMNPAPGPTPPLRTAKLDAAQIQTVLETALTRGGLAIARESYENIPVMDAPTTVFEVHAGGLDKAVRILALGMQEPQPGPDTLARENFQELRVFLENLADTAIDRGADYQPSGFTGVLIELEAEQQAPAAPKAWPWDDLAPADFVDEPTGAEFVVLPERSLTVEQLAAVGITELAGAHTGTVLEHEGKRYHLIVRPQLPDERSAAG